MKVLTETLAALASLPLPQDSAGAILLRLLASPNVASKEWVYRQYDHQVQTNTVVSPGGDAAVLRIKGTQRGISVATDGNGRYCYLDPFAGGMIAVAEVIDDQAARFGRLIMPVHTGPWPGTLSASYSWLKEQDPRI